MTEKELQERVIANLKEWQKIEDISVTGADKIIAKTVNPIMRLIMEIIKRDSTIHRRVQEIIMDSLEQRAYNLPPEELEEVWGLVEEHIYLENQTIELAKNALGVLQGKKMPVQEYLLTYLFKDETKHHELLEALNLIKKGVYPYGQPPQPI